MHTYPHTPNFLVTLSYVLTYPTSATQGGEDISDSWKVTGCGFSLGPGVYGSAFRGCSLDTALKASWPTKERRHLFWLHSMWNKNKALPFSVKCESLPLSFSQVLVLSFASLCPSLFLCLSVSVSLFPSWPFLFASLSLSLSFFPLLSTSLFPWTTFHTTGLDGVCAWLIE